MRADAKHWGQGLCDRAAPRRMLASSLAIATAMVAGPAHSQAFTGGTITSATNAARTSTGAGTETITVSARNALINWHATTPSQFLPQGNTATFVNATPMTREYTERHQPARDLRFGERDLAERHHQQHVQRVTGRQDLVLQSGRHHRRPERGVQRRQPAAQRQRDRFQHRLWRIRHRLRHRQPGLW